MTDINLRLIDFIGTILEAGETVGNTTVRARQGDDEVVVDATLEITAIYENGQITYPSPTPGD